MGKLVAIFTVLILLLVAGIYGAGFITGPSTDPDVSIATNKDPVLVSHAWKDGVHRYTGLFLLPHSCYRVDQSGYYRNGTNLIGFTIHEATSTRVPCTKIKSRFPFSVIVESPEDTPAKFVIDGEVYPSRIRETDWQSPAGSIIDTNVTEPIHP